MKSCLDEGLDGHRGVLGKQLADSLLRIGQLITQSHERLDGFYAAGDVAGAYDFLREQRSAALALKLGEAAILGDQTGEKPVALLDDVMSELDADRQDYILNHIRDWQVFITCCEPETVLRLCEGKSFRIEGGKII